MEDRVLEVALKERYGFMRSTPFGEIIRVMMKMNPSKEKIVYSLRILITSLLVFTLLILAYYAAAIKKVIDGKTMVPEYLWKVINALIDMKWFVVEFFVLFSILLGLYIFKKRFWYRWIRIFSLKFPIWLYLMAGLLLASHPFFKLNLHQFFNDLLMAFVSIFLTLLFILFFPRDIDKPFWD